MELVEAASKVVTPFTALVIVAICPIRFWPLLPRAWLLMLEILELTVVSLGKSVLS